MKASIRDLHIRTSEFVKEAEQGSVIVIERRGVPVAELHPIKPRVGLSVEAKRKIFAEMQGLWARMPYVGDTTPLLEEDRDR